MLTLLARINWTGNMKSVAFAGVEIDNGSVTHESEAKAFLPEGICIVPGNASWD
jgi:hypothetical protein